MVLSNEAEEKLPESAGNLIKMFTLLNTLKAEGAKTGHLKKANNNVYRFRSISPTTTLIRIFLRL